MSKAGKAFAWLGDLVQIFLWDRLHPIRKRYSMLASTACRSLKFHARSRIEQKPLADLLRLIAAPPVQRAILPGPDIELGDVGSHSFYYTLAVLVQALRPKTILEFGTYLGVGAHTMALNAPPQGRIFTIDLPDQAACESVPGLNAIDRGHIAASRQRVGQAFRGQPTESIITQIRADSMSFLAEQHVSNVDLVVVDGGHSLPVITQDTENALRVLGLRGAIVWDDYFHLYPDVVDYLDTLRLRLRLYVIAGTNLVMYHPAFASPTSPPAAAAP